MKKTLPVIIVLISLSLIGIIIMQVSWIKNVKLVKEEQYKHNIMDAVQEVSGYFMEQKTIVGPDNSLFSFEFLKPTIAKKFSKKEVGDKIRAAFNNHNLDEVHFEFAVTNLEQFEMYSAKFLNVFFVDTAKDFHVLYHMSAASSITTGLAPDEELIVVVPDYKSYIWKDISWIIIGAILFTIVIMAAFYITVSSFLKQKKVSEIKTDFINNMTHEFKTPLATIALAVDALKNEKVRTDDKKTEYFTGIIKDENKRMNRHVETILQAALLDKQELKLAFQQMSVNKKISDVLNNFKLQFEEQSAKVNFKAEATDDIINADETHFENLLNNLIDNAIKYSKENLQLNISTSTSKNHLKILIEDNGIGMTKDTVSKIFEKFYRAHTGNVHNVKGFGLGLSYVKTIVDLHHGKIKVDSTLGKGTMFTLEFPLAK
ncbi:MAG: HAMP domain-containing sensor histidine kinase [Bacteroidota bacterium]